MRYLIYARKSSESEERQAQSIDDQLKELRGLAQQRNLTVVGELIEARSAKAPGGRPVFAEMIARLQNGEADAILCWHVNRLFRNPVDFGTISWMLQTGALKEIHTPHQVHRFGDNVLLLSVENGMANQYILDLRRAVERGVRSRIEKGWYPHRAPEGYINRGTTIERDPERFEAIRELFGWILCGSHTVSEAIQALNRRGYTMKKLGNQGGTPLKRSTVYNLLSNIFYAGYFVRAGETFKGAHEPMISLSEFFRVQRLIKGNSTRKRQHYFAYRGLITCGDCGCQVVGEKKKKVMASGKVHHYTYYSCSNAKGSCRRYAIREEEITQQIERVFSVIMVSDEFVEFATTVIKRWRVEIQDQRRAEHSELESAVRQQEAKLSRLLDLRLSDSLDDREYRQEKKRLTEELEAIQQSLRLSEEALIDLPENSENAVALLHYGQDLFLGGDSAIKNRIAQILGSKYVLTHGRLTIEMSPVFSRIYELKQSLKFGSDSPEPSETGAGCLTWWSLLDTIRTGLLASKAQIPAMNEILSLAQADNQPPMN